MPKYSEQVTWLKQILLHGTGEQQWDTSGVWVCETHPLVPFDNSGIDFQCLCGGAGMPPIRVPSFVNGYICTLNDYRYGKVSSTGDKLTKL